MSDHTGNRLSRALSTLLLAPRERHFLLIVPIGAIEMLYCNSQSARESPFLRTKSTVNPCFTAKTLSLSKYGVSRSNICVVIDL